MADEMAQSLTKEQIIIMFEQFLRIIKYASDGDTPFSRATSPVASTSTANADTYANPNGRASPKRKLPTNNEECEIIPCKENKLNSEGIEFDSLVSEFNEIKTRTARKDILKKIKAQHFKFYKAAREYLIEKYSSPIEDSTSLDESRRCNKCGAPFIKRISMLVEHLLISPHTMDWPEDVKSVIKTGESSSTGSEVKFKKNMNEKEQNSQNIPTSLDDENSTASEDTIFGFPIHYFFQNSSPETYFRNLNVIMGDLITNANKSYFSLILNKHLTPDKKTFLSLIITYFINDKIYSNLYRLIEVTSENFMSDVLNQMQIEGLKLDRLVGIGFQVTDYENSIIESTLFDLENRIKDHLDKRTGPKIIINKYLYEPLKLIVDDSYTYISRDVETLLKETYYWFKSHNGESINDSLSNQILNSASEEDNFDDVWILKLDLVYTVAHNWMDLQEHFKSIKYPYNRWRLYDLYANNSNEMCLKLIHRSLTHFKIFFEFLNSPSVTKEQWSKKLENIRKQLEILAPTTEKPMTRYESDKENFLKNLEAAINKFLNYNNSSTPIAIPISNKKIKNIVSCINGSMNYLKDQNSTENIDLLETCIRIRFMNVNE